MTDNEMHDCPKNGCGARLPRSVAHWAVFAWAEYSEVVPIGPDGEPLATHLPGMNCPCRPHRIDVGASLFDKTLLSHREPGHPGASIERPDA